MVPLALCKQRILQPYDASYDHPLVRILVTRQSYLHSFQIVPSEGVACHSCLGQDKVWKTNYHLFYIIWSPHQQPSPPSPLYMCFQAVWVKMSEKPQWKSSQNLQFRAHFCWNCKFLFSSSEAEKGPWGIFWPETALECPLEHPKNVFFFMTERGRKRVQEWRLATFMKQ